MILGGCSQAGMWVNSGRNNIIMATATKIIIRRVIEILRYMGEPIWKVVSGLIVTGKTADVVDVVMGIMQTGIIGKYHSIGENQSQYNQ